VQRSPPLIHGFEKYGTPPNNKQRGKRRIKKKKE